MFVVNVVSGKGGTGKTLVSAVISDLLAHQGYRTLVIDLDIFVRGITALLYFGQRENLNLKRSQKRSVADVLMNKEHDRELAFLDYRGFAVCPAVSYIDEILNHSDIMPHDFESARESVFEILKQARKNDEYDVVILDSRAGFDELIAASHSCSDCSLMIEEDDKISAVTANNLLHQLQSVGTDSQVYRAINKWRGSTINDTKHLGNIHFDADVVENYGSDDFFHGIMKTTFEPSIVEIWNELCEREAQKYLLRSRRRSPIPSDSLEKRTLNFPIMERFILIYALVLLFGGGIVFLKGGDFVFDLLRDPIALTGALSSLAGAISLVFVLFRQR